MGTAPGQLAWRTAEVAFKRGRQGKLAWWLQERWRMRGCPSDSWLLWSVDGKVVVTEYINTATYSDYKGHTTFKVLVGVARHHGGDAMMVDKGFTLKAADLQLQPRAGLEKSFQ